MLTNNFRNKLFQLVTSAVMLTPGVAIADTFSISGTALNTNNQFPKLDGYPIVYTYGLNSTDPDQQFDNIAGNTGRLLKHKSTGLCLNGHYLSNGGKVNLYPCSTSDPDQNWTLNSLGSGTVSIQRAGTNYCVTMPGQGANQQIVLNGCSGAANQKFLVNGGTVTPPSNVSANTPYLPFTPGETATVTQGYTSHQGGIYPQYNNYAIDFATSPSYDVAARAVRAGKVAFAGAGNDGYGNRVVIQYNDGKYAIYGHLKSIDVTTNTIVAGGQRLGIIGNTGTSSGIHLHYAEGTARLGNFVTNLVPVSFVDAPNVNFANSNFTVVSQNPDNRR
jgi:Peptidase family M23/Ricin-type beta-trefoil lectin domain